MNFGYEDDGMKLGHEDDEGLEVKWGVMKMNK